MVRVEVDYRREGPPGGGDAHHHHGGAGPGNSSLALTQVARCQPGGEVVAEGPGGAGVDRPRPDPHADPRRGEDEAGRRVRPPPSGGGLEALATSPFTLRITAPSPWVRITPSTLSQPHLLRRFPRKRRHRLRRLPVQDIDEEGHEAPYGGGLPWGASAWSRTIPFSTPTQRKSGVWHSWTTVQPRVPGSGQFRGEVRGKRLA